MDAVLRPARVARGAARRGLRAASRYSWQLDRLLYRRRLAREDPVTEDAPQVLVYQMGKVGSLTICRSLNAVVPPLRVYHVHCLSEEGLGLLRRLHRRNWPEMPGRHVWRCEYLREALDAGRGPERWKVISLVRDPVARNISSFFHVLDFRVGFGFDERSATTPPDRLQQELVAAFREFDGHDEPLDFFDQEFRAVLNWDVFETEFDPGRGYGIYAAPGLDVLILRLEDLDRVVAEAFHEFLGLRDFELVPSNRAEGKNYGEAYQRFRSEVRFDDEYLDRMYESRYARHFYSRRELLRLRDRWSSPERCRSVPGT